MAYALGSAVYRWVVLFGIIALLYYFFDKYGMGPIGILLAILYVVMTVVVPLAKSMRFLWKQRWDAVKRLTYMGVAAAAGVTALAGVAFLPVRNSIREPLVVLSQSDETIFVRTPGYVTAVEHDVGDRVAAGDVIVRLSDPTLQNLLDESVSKREQEALKARDAAAGNLMTQLAASNDAIAAYDKQISLIRERMADLVLKAPVDGVVVWDTSLRRIVGNYVSPSMKLCRVIRTDRLEARISLPQQQAAMVKLGMPVRIRLWSNPDVEIHGLVGRVSSLVSDQLLHPALGSTSKGDVDVKGGTGETDVRSTSRRSTVVIELPEGDGEIWRVFGGWDDRARRDRVFASDGGRAGVAAVVGFDDTGLASLSGCLRSQNQGARRRKLFLG